MTITTELERTLTVTGPDGEPATIHGNRHRSDFRQLSFEVGGDAVGQTLLGTLTVSGALPVERDLDLGDEIRIQAIAADGTVIATGAASIDTPNFKTHRDKYGEIIAIERAHRAKVISE